ncbi:MAG: dTDP-4-dehydrorhamnose reductase [Bacteroidales bacterium]|nr:dTDP-4-dehydrorhamnose reductase [Bacteroidales bacterium]
MNILVTGANGQLGTEMRIVSSGSTDKYFFSDVNDVEGFQTIHLDITDKDAVRAFVQENSIDVIVNCAAFTNVDAAQSNRSLAELLNATAPSYLAAAMVERGGVLFHISTDYVFGKEPYNTPCREDRTGTPTGVYGETKLQGEKAIAASGCRYYIIRTAWLYSEYGKNFVKTMLSLTSSKPQLKVVFDQVGTPTYALDLAKLICTIISSGKMKENTGIYHYSNEGVCSWYDFTKMIQAFDNEMRTAAGEEPTLCDVQPCHSSEFPSPVIRPSYSVLDKSKVKEVFGVEIPYWTDSLRLCMKNLKKISK